ncbi:hypothetical protein BpHYR1_009150 [Brachionus plicatilis]|uniref:Uncharacterized protein n=1 Tax=Brachionus plicatilis TaxID=10195 RepID=A0A3M7PN76_BRAPC|nr:hypothetical protein BpHYR1_009150 [Brachionus plicatilis]
MWDWPIFSVVSRLLNRLLIIDCQHYQFCDQFVLTIKLNYLKDKIINFLLKKTYTKILTVVKKLVVIPNK